MATYLAITGEWNEGWDEEEVPLPRETESNLPARFKMLMKQNPIPVKKETKVENVKSEPVNPRPNHKVRSIF